jgi:chemotaxis protein methyltransferase CheR
LNESIHWVSTDNPVFFRGISHFNFISETMVSDLKAGAAVGRTRHVRIWSAACCTGEEAYSIAISLLEAFRASSESPAYEAGGWRIEVVASDVDPEALATAEEGIYSEESLAALPAEVKKRYFLRGRGDMTGRVRAKQGRADLVHFQRVDLEGTEWAIKGPFDAIFLRYGLISMHPQTQELCLRTMLLHLNPHGYLFLDPSGHVPWLRDAALPIGNGIYQLRPRGKARYTGNERRRSARVHDFVDEDSTATPDLS